MNTSIKSLLAVAAAAVSLSSCVVVPAGPGPVVYGGAPGYWSTVPVGYVGDVYWYGGRYYYGGRYEHGRYRYNGRWYDSRYYHNGHYYYGGRHEHHSGHHR